MPTKRNYYFANLTLVFGTSGGCRNEKDNSHKLKKQYVKPSGTFLRKNTCDIGFAAYVFNGLLPPRGQLNYEVYNVEKHDTYSAKFKIIKVRIEVKLLEIYFVIRSCKPTKDKKKSKGEEKKYEI